MVNCSNRTNSNDCEPDRLIDEVLSKSTLGHDEIRIGYLRGYYFIDINDNDISYPRFFVPSKRGYKTVVYYTKSGSKIAESLLDPPSYSWNEVYPTVSLKAIYDMILWMNDMHIQLYRVSDISGYIYVETHNCSIRRESEDGELKWSVYTHK